ncbi:MAG: hypothetical protein N3D10_03510 [Candidatus Micrarchaeota archaeon]|nr:hypothetical protein [Candidatus Micrarchaeota archaeon]
MQKILFLILILFFLFSGCIYIETYQKFYPNGQSTVLYQIKYDNFIEVIEKTNIKNPQNISWSEFIEKTCRQLGNLTNFNYICNIKNEWLIVESTKISSQNYVFSSYNSFPFDIYELKIFGVPDLPLNYFFNSSQIQQLSFNSSFNSDKKYLMQLEGAGLNYKYTIDVPGKIIEYNTGQIVDENLVVNPFDVAYSETKYIYVKSRELNVSQAAILIILFLILFLFFDLVLVWAITAFNRKSIQALERKKLLEEQRGKKIIQQEQDNTISFNVEGEKKIKK